MKQPKIHFLRNPSLRYTGDARVACGKKIESRDEGLLDWHLDYVTPGEGRWKRVSCKGCIRTMDKDEIYLMT